MASSAETAAAPHLIDGLDHLVLLAQDADEARALYTGLFGRAPSAVFAEDGVTSMIWPLENGALEIMAPTGDTDAARHLRHTMETGGEGLKSLAFRTGDIEAAHRTLTRRGLAPGDISYAAREDETGQRHAWSRFRCEDAASGGLKLFVLSRETPLPAPDPAPDTASRIDHIVISTRHPERALATFGARLGFRLALDRRAEQWNTRFLFFRHAELTYEVVQRLDETPDPETPEALWGVTWQVGDIEAAHARINAAGIETSQVRTGRKPGSRVFSLKARAAGVRTLFISHDRR